MEATIVQKLQYPTWSYAEKFVRKPSISVLFHRRIKEEKNPQVLISAQMHPNRTSNRHRFLSLAVACSIENLPASTLESGSCHAPFDEVSILKNKSQEIEPYLNGRCIYLVGMMGSGKTTVGKDVDGTSVAEIFKLYGEGFFRNKETEVLKKLSLMHRLVISTGGGVVMQPINWKYMHNGITVWLDVPLEALAQRIAAVGTDSRPLLDQESGDPYTKALKRLSTLWEERGEEYANAHARVSLENLATKLGLRDVSNITPTTIAIEALEQIGNFLREDGDMVMAGV